MIHRMYSIFDVKVEAFNVPFFAPSDGAAVRNFAMASKDPQTVMHSFPHDYELWFVGQFDDTRGCIFDDGSEASQRRQLGNAAEAIRLIAATKEA